MKKALRICFCADSIAWIARHLKKSAKAHFRKMITGKVKSIRSSKKRFSQKQLAAQRLFAKRARAGTLRHGRRKRRRN